jgi:hypothetical protein
MAKCRSGDQALDAQKNYQKQDVGSSENGQAAQSQQKENRLRLFGLQCR